MPKGAKGKKKKKAENAAPKKSEEDIARDKEMFERVRLFD